MTRSYPARETEHQR